MRTPALRFPSPLGGRGEPEGTRSSTNPLEWRPEAGLQGVPHLHR